MFANIVLTDFTTIGRKIDGLQKLHLASFQLYGSQCHNVIIYYGVMQYCIVRTCTCI